MILDFPEGSVSLTTWGKGRHDMPRSIVGVYYLDQMVSLSRSLEKDCQKIGPLPVPFASLQKRR